MTRNIPVVTLAVIVAVVLVNFFAQYNLGMASENVTSMTLSGLFGLATGTGLGVAIGKSQRAEDKPPEIKS